MHKIIVDIHVVHTKTQVSLLNRKSVCVGKRYLSTLKVEEVLHTLLSTLALQED